MIYTHVIEANIRKTNFYSLSVYRHFFVGSETILPETSVLRSGEAVIIKN